MSINKGSIEKGKFLLCGHLANMENTYRGKEKIARCKACKKLEAKDRKERLLEEQRGLREKIS